MADEADEQLLVRFFLAKGMTAAAAAAAVAVGIVTLRGVLFLCTRTGLA